MNEILQVDDRKTVGNEVRLGKLPDPIGHGRAEELRDAREIHFLAGDESEPFVN
jgi:hypothetical protein